MFFEEYKQIFEEIFSVTKQIESLCLKKRSDETDELFNKRNELMNKLSPPEDIDEEKFQYICDLREKIKQSNQVILKIIQDEKQKAFDEIQKLAKQINTNNTMHTTSSVKQSNISNTNSSIFNKND